MYKKKVLIIIVNYNGLNDTMGCIESLSKSDHFELFDILVIDNGSNNNEGELLKGVFPYIFIIRLEDNIGFSGGFNKGIKYAIENNYEYILTINNDTIVKNDMIDKLLEANDGNSLCTPKMYYYYEPEKIYYCGGGISKYTGKAFNYHEDKLNVEKFSFGNLTCGLLSTSVIKKVGNFDEDYFMYCEDVDYCLRLIDSGIDIIIVPDAKLWHKISRSSGGGSSPFSLYYQTRNRFYLIKKFNRHFSFTAIPFSLFFRYIRAIQYYLFGKKKGRAQGRAIIKGINDYFKGVKGKVDKFE